MTTIIAMMATRTKAGALAPFCPCRRRDRARHAERRWRWCSKPHTVRRSKRDLRGH